MTVSEYIVKFLKEKKIDVVFVLQGGMITRLIDAIYKDGSIRIVTMHHEQAVAMAVDAYGRVNNRPSVGFATSGPGATNLLTGIACAYFDSVPAIFITGQVNSHEIKGDNPTRQIGFQETDIVKMARPITKASYSVISAERVPVMLDMVYNVAVSGRMGAVLLDIPIDIQNEDTGIC